MDTRKKVIQFTIIGIFIIGIIVISVLIAKQNKVIDDLESEKANIEQVKEKSFKEKITQEEVKEYESKTNKKLDLFLEHKYGDDSPDDEGSAYNAIRALFTVPSHKIVLTNKSPEKDFIKYYKPFKYEISNFSAVKEDNDVKVIFNIETKYDGKVINENNDLMTLTFDENDNLKGGSLYAK
ncbi:hypothetical protein [Staphylococcus aureus]|uniref:hypothetical protein n=1 Tax=Staphylococcus aureus TaxID=1280 RepID=UPI001243F2EE|nr:hypothetical protein [Staphylococcus aureus]